MSDSVRPQRRQPIRLPRPWDSPGKNTGVGCHFLLQCMKVKSESQVAQSYLTLSDPMDYSLPGFSIHRIFQAKVLEWGAIAFSRKHVLTSSIYMQQSNFPSTVYWRDCLFPSVYSHLLYWLLIDHLCVKCALGSLFCSIDLYDCFVQISHCFDICGFAILDED